MNFSSLGKIFRKEMFKSSLLVSFSKAFASLSNLLFMIYAVNILSRAENGHLQFYLGYVPLLLAVAEFGLPNAMVKYLSAESENSMDTGSLLSASLFLKLVSLFILTLIGAVMVFLYDFDPVTVFIIVSGGLITSFISYFESMLVAYREYASLAVWNPAGNLMRLGILYFSNVSYERSLNHLDVLSIYCLSPGVTLFLFFILFRKHGIRWTGTFKGFKIKIKELALFNLWAFAASLFAIASDRLEIFFLKKYHTPETVAVYGTALQLFSGFLIVFATLNSLILPRLSKAYGTEDFNKFLIKAVAFCIFCSFLLSPGYFLAEPILNFLFQNKYSDSIPVFKILYPNYLLQMVFAPLGIALFAMGKPSFLAFLALIRLIFGVFFDVLLIPELGPSGAAFSFLLGQVVSWLVLAGYFLAAFWK